MHQQWSEMNGLQQTALICAKLIGDDLEELHSQGVIPAERMPEFNAVLRNSLYEALWVVAHTEDSDASQEFLAYAIEAIPEHWEPPAFSERFVEVVRQMDGRSPDK